MTATMTRGVCLHQCEPQRLYAANTADEDTLACDTDHDDDDAS